MESGVYAAEAELEATHWWYVGRRQLFARELANSGIGRDAAVLDVGSGAGTNLRMLRELGFLRVTALDYSEEALRFCRDKGFGRLSRGDICALPFADGSFDLVLATDIIEHVDDDLGALGEIRRVLRPGGMALVSVPAFSQLWGLQDRVSHHRRRYRMAPLRSKFERAGLRLSHAFYFNYLMFLPIWIVRRLIERLHIEIESETRLISPLVNRVCNAIFRADVGTAPLLHPPFGVSILVVAGR
ncbi:MAG TPA: methyltransferase domain-containing protein [Stellaceae bacterium]|nr:methyltransferase domain-containing protein [Stellaceae bacterium]